MPPVATNRSNPQPSKHMVEPTPQVLNDQLKNVHISKSTVEAQIKTILAMHPVTSKHNFNIWLQQAIGHIDLTTLAGDDTRSNVFRLCQKAVKHGTAAVCVYPNRVQDAYEALKSADQLSKINIASVATGFPSGLYPLQTRLLEIKFAVSSGATEIDVVLDRSLVLTGQWQAVYNEVQEMKQACGSAKLKVILGTGQLGSYENVYKASMVSMLAGADFIKTSTGMEAVNATLPVGLIMCRAIRKYYQMTGNKVGLKPAGGIKIAQDAVNWLVLIYAELGPEWLTPKLFRIGASSLLDQILDKLAEKPVIKEESSGY